MTNYSQSSEGTRNQFSPLNFIQLNGEAKEERIIHLNTKIVRCSPNGSKIKLFLADFEMKKFVDVQFDALLHFKKHGCQ